MKSLNSLLFLPHVSRRFASVLSALCCFIVALPAIAAAAPIRAFDIPAGAADKALKQFVAQSGVELIFGTAAAAQATTNAVKGNYAPREALTLLLQGTGLVVVANEKTGALTVSRDPKALRTAQNNESDRTDQSQVTKNAASRKNNAEDGIIELSPFVVRSDQDRGYQASNTMSGTRLNSNIDDLAASITVVDKQQLQDTASVDINDIFINEVSTEGTHQFNASSIDRNGNAVDAGTDPNTANRVRGLSAANLAVEGFASTIPIDTYNLDAVEISRGPNSNIFSLSAASGTVNMIPAAANLSRAAVNFTLRGDSYGGRRSSFDINEPIIGPKLAVRLLGLYDDKGYERQPSVDRTKRMTVAVSAQPFRSTVINASYEHFDNFNRRPNTVTPKDYIAIWQANGSPTWDPTTWTVHLNGKSIVVPTTQEALLPSVFLGSTASEYTRPSLYVDNGNAELFMVNRSAIASASAPSPFNNNSNARLMEIGSNLPPLYSAPAISNKNLYDYTSVNLLQPNAAFASASVYRLTLQQSLLNTDRQLLAFQLGYYREKKGGVSHNFLGTGQGTPLRLFIDVNEKLLNGQANPYYLRPYFGGTDIRVGVNDQVNNDYRATMAYQLDLTKSGGIAHWIGKHRFTGYGEFVRQEGGTPAGREYTLWTAPGATQPTSPTVPMWRYYLAESAGQYITHAPEAPSTFAGKQNLQWYNYQTSQWQTDSTEVRDIYYAGLRAKQEVKTRGMVWQGFLLGDRVIPTLGVRRDADLNVSSNAALNAGLANANILPLYTFSAPWQEITGTTQTKGIVAKPLSFLSLHYNQSDSFTPALAGINILGKSVPYPTGQGKDWGFAANLLQGKVVIRVNRYETWQKNARDSNLNVLSQRAQRMDFGIPTSSFANCLYNAAEAWTKQLHPDWSVQQVDGTVYQTLGLTQDFVTNLQNAGTAGVLADSSESFSKGDELEVNVNPNRDWTLKVTASRMDAKNVAIAPTTQVYIDQRMPVWTSVKDPTTGLYWWTQNTNPNVAGSTNANIPINYYLTNVEEPYLLAVATLGKSRPQVRKWHLNALTSYHLAGITSNQFLKNVTVGGGMRWESQAAIGYLGGAPDPLSGIVYSLDTNKPVFDKAHLHTDVMFAYSLRWFDNKVRCRVQLNVRDVFENGGLRPIAVNPDGQVSLWSIVDPRQCFLTMSFDM